MNSILPHRKPMGYGTIFNRSIVFGIFLLIAGCLPSQWKASDMTTSDDWEVLTGNEYDGSIPTALKDWKVVTDVSEEWFSCDYSFLLRYTTLSVDEENRIWIYGPDNWFGPNGEQVPDAPNCDENVRPRIIRYDPVAHKTERVQIINLDEGASLSSARGWNHIGNGRILLTSVYIYSTPWDGADGGAGNKYIDFAILEGEHIRDLGGGNSNIFAVPSYTISNNILYAISSLYSNEIKILNLNTEKWVDIVQPSNCDSIVSIEVVRNNFFLLCRTPENDYKVQMYTKNMDDLAEWKLDGGNSVDFPLKADSQGRIWIGDQYIIKFENGEWVIDRIVPEENVLFYGLSKTYRRTIFGIHPYKNMMLFNLEGAIYLGDYDDKQWISLIHRLPPLPMTVAPDGNIYAFTGKYIISSRP